jgi:hypothetical protein
VASVVLEEERDGEQSGQAEEAHGAALWCARPSGFSAWTVRRRMRDLVMLLEEGNKERGGGRCGVSGRGGGGGVRAGG